MASEERVKTLTVAELRAALAAYPDDYEVWATWEGVHAPILTRHFEDLPRARALVIDVEAYGGGPKEKRDGE